MPAVLDALSRLWEELALLAVQTARALGQLFAPVLGLMLLGWSAYELSILLSSTLPAGWYWVAIPILAVGMVLQLATILAVLRMAAVHLGIPAMLSRASIGTEVTDSRDTSALHLLTITLLPFLGMYAAFGFVQSYASDLVKLSTYRQGFGDLLESLNPLHSQVVLVWTIGIVAAGWLFKKLIDPWRERSRYPLFVGLLQILVQATLALVALMVAFRIFDAIGLWLQDRVYHAWLDQGIGWVKATFHVDLPDFLSAAWTFWSQTLWPVLFSGLTRPLLWLAMAGLVFGAKVLSLADLWRLGEPAAGATTRRERMLARLRADTEQARGIRLLALRGQSFLLGGLDGTIIPAWQSLRLVLRAGWPFLGAYMIAFTLVDLAGTQLERAFFTLLGGHPIDFWLRLLPLFDLIRLVLVMGVTWVMLAVAYTRALSIFAERTGDDVEPVLVPGTVGVRRALRSGPAEAVTVLVIVSLVVVSAGRVPTDLGHETNRVALGQPGDLQGQQVTVGQPRLARSIEIDASTIPSDVVLVVVPATVSAPGPDPVPVIARLVAGDRTYDAWAGQGAPTVTGGFRASGEMVFEVEPADVGPSLSVRFEPLELVTSYEEWVEVPLGFSDGAATRAQASTEVQSTPTREAA